MLTPISDKPLYGGPSGPAYEKRYDVAPPVNLLYRANQRRNARARVFIDFVTALFRDMEAAREHGIAARVADRPDWYGRRYGHVSAALRSRK